MMICFIAVMQSFGLWYYDYILWYQRIYLAFACSVALGGTSNCSKRVLFENWYSGSITWNHTGVSDRVCCQLPCFIFRWENVARDSRWKGTNQSSRCGVRLYPKMVTVDPLHVGCLSTTNPTSRSMTGDSLFVRTAAPAPPPYDWRKNCPHILITLSQR